jgi:hypothetical protein
MLVIFWILCGLFACVVAGNKGHNGCMWAIGGFLLGPLALLATLGLGDRKSQRAQDDLLEETRRQNEWMRRKMYEAEEERRYYEEERYRQRMRQLPPEEYYEEEEYDEHYDYDGYDDEYVDVEATEGDNETDNQAADKGRDFDENDKGVDEGTSK